MAQLQVSTAPKQGQVFTNLDELNQATDALQEAWAQLQERVEPVLGPSNPKSVGGDDSPKSPSALAVKIKSNADKVWGVVNSIRDTYARIEL